MNNTQQSRSFPPFWHTLFLLALIAAGVWFFLKIGTIVAYFAISGAIAYVLNPAVEAMCARRIPRGIAILLVFLFFIGIVVAGLVFIIPPAAKQFDTLVENMPQYFETLKGAWERVVRLSKSTDLPVRIETLPEQVAGDLQNVVASAGKSLFSSIGRFFSGLAALIIVPILVYYFLKDGPLMRSGFLRLMPAQYRSETDRVLTQINKALGGFIRGQLKLCLAMGVLTFLSLVFVPGMQYALLFGIIAGVTEFIPYLGPILALIGPLIFATTVSWKLVAIVLVLFMIIQVIEGNILAPRIIGSDVNMHPAMIMLVLMAGGNVGGIVGMIAAIPVAVILKVLFDYFYIGKVVTPSENPAAAGPEGGGAV